MKVEAWSKMEDRYAFWILQKDVLITVEGYFKPEKGRFVTFLLVKMATNNSG